MIERRIGKMIREARIERGMTQQELASVLCVSPTTISKWENGRSMPDISMLELLTKTLDLSFEEVVFGKYSGPETADVDRNKQEGQALLECSSLHAQKSSKKGRVVSIVLGIALLATALTVTSLIRAKQPHYSYSLDISALIEVKDAGASASETILVYDEKQFYQYWKIEEKTFETLLKNLNIHSPDEIGKVVAYRNVKEDTTCCYYSTVEGISGEWLIEFIDDGSGALSVQNAQYLYGTKESAGLVLEKIFSGSSYDFRLLQEQDREDQMKYLVDEPYCYPLTPGTEEWKNTPIETLYERSAVPSGLAETMTTRALLRTVLEYPFIVNIYAWDTPQQGIDKMRSRFEPLDILLKRDDALGELSAYLSGFDKAETEESEIIKYYLAGRINEYIHSSILNKQEDPSL